jgi:hypothetical protein
MGVFLTTPPVAGATHFVVDGIGQDGQPIAAQPDGSLKVEVDALEPGDYRAQIYAGNVWGLSAEPFEFPFNRPAAIAAPIGAQLVDA